MSSNWIAHLARRGFLVLGIVLFLHGGAGAQPTCLGDCDGEGQVTVAEIIVGVNIALGTTGIGACPNFDRDGDSIVAVDEIIVAVQNALNGCGGGMTPTQPAGTATAQPTPTASARPTVPATPNFTIHGKVSQAAANGGGVSPASNAHVAASIDRNANGRIDTGESIAGVANGEGEYSLRLAVADGEQVVVSFRTDNVAPLYRTVPAAPGMDTVVNVILREAEDLTCDGAGCALQGNRLSIEGLPAGVSGAAQIFNPVTQADAFPGDFADSNGDLLLSGVFASVELENQVGQPVKQLPSPATLRMQIPRETWSIIADIVPGNGRIDVPLYAFDEAAGTWVRDGAGVLEDSNQALIPETSLASIRNGSYTGNVVARGEVMHFSYWNVDWPIESHACVGGCILTDDGMPARGASVTARGLTYTGTSPTTMTDQDGCFCIDALRSENPGEDVDQDGVPGETQTVSIRVVHNGRIYDGGQTDTPRQAGTCGGPCGSIGDLRLTPDRELHPALCSVTITVRDRDGAAVAGALVFAADDTVDPDVAFDLCLAAPQGFCMSAGVTDGNGMATLTNVVIDSLFYAAYSFTDEGDSSLQRWGEGTSSGCPLQPLTLTLTEGYRLVTLALQLTPPSTISWTPTTYPVTNINVTSIANLKWSVMAAGAGINPPVVYGTVPPGATQIIPLNNAAPPPLSSGDFIALFVDAPGTDGYPVIGQGFAVVP